MTRRPVAWTHDGAVSAVVDAPFPAQPAVECTTSIVTDAGSMRVHFLMRAFADAGAEWVGAFKPVGTNLAGVHCFQRAITEDIREVTFAWTNAVTDTKSHGGAFYFRDLRFEFAPDWHHIELARPKVDPAELQYFPVLGQLTRRFVIYRGGAREKAYAHLKTPPNPKIGAFGPSRTPLPNGVGVGEEARLLNILATGAPSITFSGASDLGFYSPRMGVWLPYGDPKSYAHGGEDIYPFPRAGSPVWHEIRSDLTAERQRTGALKPSGRPWEAHEWPSDFEYRCDRGPHPIMRLPPFRIANGEHWSERKWNIGAVAYEPDFATRQGERGYSAYDPHHGCRAILDALAHYYKTGCPLNRLRVQLAAQDYTTSYRLTQVGNEDPKQGWVLHSLHNMQTAADRAPGSGGRIQREMAWISWTVAQAIAITHPDDPMRERMKTWLRALLRYLQTVRLTNGTFYCGWPDVNSAGQLQGGSDDGIPWRLESLQANGWTGRALEFTEGELPVFQAGLLLAGIDEAGYALGLDVADLIAKCARFIYGKPELWVRDQYNPSGRGPAWYTRVFSKGAVDPEYSFGVGFAHTVHSRDTLARAYRRTGDVEFLELARKVAQPITAQSGETPKQALARAYAGSTDPWGVTVRAATGAAA